MSDKADHQAQVDAWIERAATGASPEARVDLFETVLARLWEHSQTTLGDVTLSAIADRVLADAVDRFPVLAALTVEPTTGVQCRTLRDRAGSASESELHGGIRFVLVEFLTVLGNLTAEVLTSELHEQLSSVGPPAPLPAPKGARGSGRGSARTGRGDRKS